MACGDYADGIYQIFDFASTEDGEVVIVISYNTNTKKMEFLCIMEIISEEYDINCYAVVLFTMGEGDSTVKVEQEITLTDALYTTIGRALVDYDLSVANYKNDNAYYINMKQLEGNMTSSTATELAYIYNSGAFEAFDIVLEDLTGYDLNYLGFKSYVR